MKKYVTKILISILVFLIAGAIYYFLQRSVYVGGDNKVTGEITKSFKTQKINMKISSPAFEHNAVIPSKYTCDGENVNPLLQISEAPENAKSLVLVVDDPDAPAGTWLHWAVWNINPQTREIAEDSVPGGGVEGITDFGKTGYGGPCPHSGTHRYFFKLYALDTVLDLPAGASLEKLQKAMEGHILDKAEFVGLYSRE